jgi:hypothetical protein
MLSENRGLGIQNEPHPAAPWTAQPRAADHLDERAGRLQRLAVRQHPAAAAKGSLVGRTGERARLV